MPYRCSPNSTEASPFTAVIILCCVLLFAGFGCTSAPTLYTDKGEPDTGEIRYCRNLFNEFVRTADQYAVTDAQTYAVAGFPYLHTNRFLTMLAIDPEDPAQLESWFSQAQSLALETYSIEYANLPQAEQQRLLQKTKLGSTTFTGELGLCAHRLSLHDLNNPARRKSAISLATVPDDYQTWQRVLGLYAITALPVVYGINNWHEESTRQLRQAYAAIPTTGKLIRYEYKQGQSPSRPQIAGLIKQSIDNPLGIPAISQSQLESLFASYAPVFEIDTATDSDRIGKPGWKNSDTASVDTKEAQVFYKLSYTFFNNQILPQLNYIIWFPSRPCDSFFDILCGHMDGIMWRVTLNHEGTPIHYDTVHNCGCYHTFFPTRHIHKRHLPESFEEQAFTPAEAPDVHEGGTVLLRIAARSHHIVSIVKLESSGTPIEKPATTVSPVRYTFTDYNQLRSLQTLNGQHKSLFQSDGLVAGTQRSERFILWPMGVPSPGSMRQWGHHATAFVGRRYFDDPCLLDRYYTSADNKVDVSTTKSRQSRFMCDDRY